MCTGACLAPAAQHWGEWGLGPTPREPPPARLAPVAPQPLRIRIPRRQRLHVCNDMRMYANTICNNNP